VSLSSSGRLLVVDYSANRGSLDRAIRGDAGSRAVRAMRDCCYCLGGPRALSSERVSLQAGGGLDWLDRLKWSLRAPEVGDHFCVSLDVWTEDEHLETIGTGFE